MFTKRSIAALFITFTLLISASADSQNPALTMYSISTAPNNNTKDYQQGSIEGGAYLYIKGSGFSTTSPSDNKVRIGNLSCPVIPYLTTPTQIVCEMPPGKEDSYDVSIDVGDKHTSTGSNYYLAFSYENSSTPQLEYLIPTAATPGEEIQHYGIQRVDSSLGVDFLKIGGHRCDSTRQNEFNVHEFRTDSKVALPCNVPIMQAGYYNATQRNFNNSGNAKKLATLPIYRFNGEPYDFAVVPRIDSISSNNGSSEGQIITIKGEGFSLENNEVSYGNTQCKIITQSSEEIQCELQKKAEGPVESYHSGVNWVALEQGDSEEDVKEIWSKTRMALETPKDSQGSYMEKLSGYFKAPTEGSYKFYASGGKGVEVRFGKTAEDKEKIVEIKEGTPYKFYYAEKGQISKSIELQKDKLYYIEVYHQLEEGSKNFATLGVQIPKAENMVNPTPLVQSIKITCPMDSEVIDFSIHNAESGEWRIRFDYIKDDGTLEKSVGTKELPYGASAEDVKNSLTADAGLKTEVVRKMYNETDDVTEEIKGAKSIVYTVTFLTPRDNKHFPVLEKKNLKGRDLSIEVELMQFASSPLNGDFEIKYKGVTHTLSYDFSAQVLENMFRKDGTDYFTPIRFYQTGNPVLGAEWIIQFSGEPFGEEKSIEFVQSKLTGCKETPKVEIITLQKASKDLFYEVIPFDLLFSASEGPQLTVKSNGIQATCPNFNCGYSVLEDKDIPKIKAFSYAEGTLGITIDKIATTKPSESDTRVYFGNNECRVTSLTLSDSSAEIMATCPAPEAGDYSPRVRFTGLGYAKTGSGVSKTTIDLKISPVTQTISPNGGNILKISGSGFPASVQAAEEKGLTVEIGGHKCELISVTSTSFECVTPPAKAEDKLVVKLGEKKAEILLQLITAVPAITEITPSSGSPAGSTEITITGILFDEDSKQTAVLVKDTENTNSYKCVITSANTTNIICKLDIIPAGKYTVTVQTSQGYTESKPFEVKTEIISVSPSKGSIAGGTNLTIEGNGFSSNPKQMEVLIGEEKIPCDVLESSADKVICQTRPGSDTILDKDQEITVVVLKNSKSQCKEPSKCNFMYSKEVTPTVISTSGHIIIPGRDFMVSGIGIGSETTSKVIIDGKECIIVNTTTNEIYFKLPDDFIPRKEYYELIVAVPGKGHATFQGIDHKIQVLIALDNISPKVGPKDGALLTLTGAGFHNGITVKVGQSLCEIRSLNLTHIICKATNEGQVSLEFGDLTDITCADCSLTLNGDLTFTVTSISPERPEKADLFDLKVDGNKLAPGPFEVRLIRKSSPTGISFLGQTKSSSETEIIASFVNVAAGDYTVEVSSGSNFIAATQQVIVPLTINTPTVVESSIAGGALLKISGSGFYNNENKNKNQVSVCELPCEIVESSETSISCQTPRFVNSAVKAVYPNIIKASTIKPSAIWSDSKDEAKVFDSDITTVYKSENIDCEIGLDIGAGLVAEISEIKFFPDSTPEYEPERFNGTVIEGSSDLKTYSPIATMDENTHDGWNTLTLDNKARYRYFRVKGGSYSNARCALAELQLFGTVLSDNTGEDLEALNCKARVNVNGQVQETAENSVTYKKSKTAEVKSVTPTTGTTAGGITVTIDGTGFGAAVENVKVYIDGIECAVKSVIDTRIECTSGAAPELSNRRSSLNSELKVQIVGNGFAVVDSSVRYYYVDKWSDVKTWGGVSLPGEGENVTIPANQTVLLDISPAKLGTITVEGALIFDDNDIELHCDNIIVLGGRLQIGIFQAPIQKKITVTLYGDRESRQLKDLGNKMIVVKDGVLDIHGKARSHTWTLLSATANEKDTSIVVKGAVDWEKGEQIVIASTEHDPYQSEIRTITEITPDAAKGETVIKFNEPLKYKHYGEIWTVNEQKFELRAEVGLLTRNVVIQGDESSEKSLYGCHITTYSTTGDESSIGRISYAEIRRAGQAEIIGRHPIQFNLIGNVRESFILGNSVHNTYNRAINIHGAHFLKVQKNVAYWVMGHTIFTEDGIETNNAIEDNLVINTLSSNALLYSDQSPASFWITNPNNIVRRNRAAGSDRYGFWYDLSLFPEGASATNTICPNGEKLGQFTENEAHSNSEDGLKISTEYVPRKFPCSPYVEREANPFTPTQFDNFLSWKNRGDAVVAEKLGAVLFKNIKAIDNIRAGIEISDITRPLPGAAKTVYVEDAWIIGALNSATVSATRDSRGLVTPRADRFGVKNINFVNMEHNMTAIETCSHCEYSISAGEGARTSYFEGLKFTNVTRKVRFNTPYKEILTDEDGSLTEKEGGGAVTCYCEHMDVPGCEHKNDVFNGLVCDKTVSIRRVVFENVIPVDEFKSKKMYVSRVDKDGKQGSPSKIAAELKLDFENSWAVPFATGYTYNISWENQKDFEKIKIKPSEIYSETDKAITLVFNHTEYRQVYEVLGTNIEGNNLGLIPNTTSLWENTAETTCGQWHHDSQTKHLYIAVSGKELKQMDIVAYACKENCVVEELAIAKEHFVRKWSNKTQWANGELPKDGDDVEIPPSWTIYLDTNTSSLGTLTIKGDLHFNGTDNETTVLTAQRIWVKGQLIIGNVTNRYLGKARISLTGTKDSKDLVIGESLKPGKKVLAVTGNLSIYGSEVTKVYTYLQEPVQKDATVIKVPKDINWRVGDDIVIAPSQMSPIEYETRTIKEIKEGVITLDKALEYYHFGGNDVTKKTDHGVIDMRAEVGLLTRNIVIEGSSEDDFGGTLYVGRLVNEQTEIASKGKVEFDGVEMKNLGQDNLAGITFVNAVVGEKEHSVITRSVVRDSLGCMMRLVRTGGVLIEQNIFYKSVKHQLVFELENTHIKLLKNLFIGNTAEPVTEEEDEEEAFTAALYVKGHVKESEISGNTIAGCAGHCIVADGGDCSANKKSSLKDNIAHSGETGWLVKSPGACTSISDFVGYKLEAGIQSYFLTTHIETYNIAVSDCHIGIMTNTAGILESEHKISLKDSYFGGLLLPSSAYVDSVEDCRNLTAVYIPVSTEKGKTVPPEEDTLPWRKINSNHVWKSTFTVENVTFENYKNDLIESCGDPMHLFRSNDAASDASASTVVSKIKLSQVGEDNKVYYGDFHPEWIDLEDCGDFPCTGIKNIVIRDLDGTLMGKKASIVPHNKAAKAFESCEHSAAQNSYICKGNGWGLLTFESLDLDASSMPLAPVTVYTGEFKVKKSEEEGKKDEEEDDNGDKDEKDGDNEEDNAIEEDDSGYVNVLNSYMDHGNELERLSRFHAIVETGDTYKIKFEGELPDGLAWQLQGAQASENIQIEYSYSDATSVRVANKKDVKTPLWKKTEKGVVDLKECGDYTYDGENSKVIIKLTGAENCLVRVDAANSIHGRFEYKLSYADFVKNKGSESFIKTVKDILEVNEQSIRIVKVQDNLLEFLVDATELNVTADDDNSEIVNAAIKEELDSMLEKLNEKVTTGGFKVLDSAVTGSAFKLMLVNPSEPGSGSGTGTSTDTGKGSDEPSQEEDVPGTMEVIDEEMDSTAFIKGIIFIIGGVTVLIGLYFCCLLTKSSKAQVPKQNFEMVAQEEHSIDIPTDASMSQSQGKGKKGQSVQRYHAD